MPNIAKTVRLTPEQQALVEKNWLLAYGGVRRHRRLLAFINKDDMLCEFNLALCHAAQKYRPESGASFSHCAFWWFRAAISKLLRDYRRRGLAGMKREDQCDYDEAPVEELPSCRNRGSRDGRLKDLSEMQEEYELLKGFLDQRQIEVIEGRMAGLTLQEIASRLGMTRERVRQIEASAINRLQYHMSGRE